MGTATTRYLDLLEACLTGTLYEDPPMDLWNGQVKIPGTFNPRARQFGHDWPLRAHTMVGVHRLRNLREAAEYVLSAGVPGDFIEAGVWRGGASIYLAGIMAVHAQDFGRKLFGGSAGRRLFVADSFEGLPAPTHQNDQGDNHHSFSPLAVGLDEVRANFQKYGLLSEQVVFVKGWFKDTLADVPSSTFALVRLDGDMYESTRDAIEALYPRLSPNGFLIVDDYHALKSCQKAVDEYREKHGITEPIHEIDGTGVYWQK